MNKTKRALTSMIIISTVFCITIIFNIQLPFFTGKGHNNSAEDAITASTAAEETEEGVISLNRQEAELFSEDSLATQNNAAFDQAAADDLSSEDGAASSGDTSSNTDSQTNSYAGAEGTSADQEVTSIMSLSSEAAQASNEATDASGNTTEEQAAAEGDASQGEEAGSGNMTTGADNSTTGSDQNAATEDDASVTETKEKVEEEQPEAQYANIGISVAKDYVNIRKEPSTNGEVLGKLYRDSACTILKTEGDWYYVESGSVTGYVKAEYIKTGIPDDELIEKYSILNISVGVDGLNVRKEPSTESKKLTCIYLNEKYPVVKVEGDWILIHIEDENIDGYVKKEFADLIVSFKDAVSKEEEEKILQLQAEERAKKETEIKYNGGVNYSEEDLMLLACLVHSEAGTQSYEGKLAVANIVLNRVKSSKYPDSIKSVIYQDGQFSVASSGSLEKQLNNYDNYSSKSQLMSIKAARDALEGANNIGKRLYFHSYRAATKEGYTSYSSSVKIGDHVFW